MCKGQAKLLSDRRAEFTAKGIKLVAISSVPDNLEEFRESVWPEDDIYVDDGEVFKDSLKGGNYRNWWLAKPSVILAIARAMALGNQSNDMSPKTAKLGGTIVVKDEAVVLAQAEGTDFSYASPDSVLKLF